MGTSYTLFSHLHNFCKKMITAFRKICNETCFLPRNLGPPTIVSQNPVENTVPSCCSILYYFQKKSFWRMLVTNTVLVITDFHCITNKKRHLSMDSFLWLVIHWKSWQLLGVFMKEGLMPDWSTNHSFEFVQIRTLLNNSHTLCKLLD